MYVKIPKDINEYEQKVFKGLSIRELVFGTLAILIGLLLSFLGMMLKIPGEIVSFAVMATVIPVFMIGFIRKDGIPMDKWLAYAFEYVIYSKRCLYDTEIGGEINVGIRNSKKRKKQKQINEADG